MKKIYAAILLFAGIISTYAQSYIEGYEYWFNNDYANRTTTPVASARQLSINQTIPTTELNNGINILNFRSFDNSGRYSSVVSHYFYKTSLPESNANPVIAAYEYWLDNDYENAVLVNSAVQQQLNLNELLSMSTLSNGIHNFNIRFKDNTGMWSSTVRHFFYKTPEQTVTQNMITGYRYWFDDDIANAVNLSLTQAQQVNVIENLDLTQLPKGIYEINFQFKDILGKWSAVITDTVEKLSLPVARFSYSTAKYCDSTVITFTNNSTDGNENLWDFGDGTNSTSVNPTHTYYTPDTYHVSLTVTDTISGADSTFVIPVTINTLHTDTTINETACFSYTSPDGQVYTTSGIITVTIPGAAGCDSTITINLTINNVDVSVTQMESVLSANAGDAVYQWLDCSNNYSIINGETSQTYTATANGTYAVEITQNNCVDTSACFIISTVGIPENTFGHKIWAYPNPTDGLVKIDLGETLDEFTVTINDLSGHLISRSSYEKNRMFEISLNVQPGIYLMTINSGSKSATIRLIKK